MSDTYWPWAWPAPTPITLSVRCGSASRLTLPRRHPGPLDAGLPAFGEPETGAALSSETTMLRPGGRRVQRDLATGETEVQFDLHGSRVRIIETDTEMGEENTTTYRIVEGDPLTATVVCRVLVTLDRPGPEHPHRGAQHDDL